MQNHKSSLKISKLKIEVLTQKFLLFPLISNYCWVFFHSIRDDETEFYNIGTSDEHHEHLFNECEIMNHVFRFLSRQVRLLSKFFFFFSHFQTCFFGSFESFF
jgi:hypothetical protein